MRHGDGVYAYQWSDQNGDNLWGSWFDPSQLDLSTWVGADEVFITLTDGCGFEVMDSIEVEYNIPPIEITVEESVDVLEVHSDVSRTRRISALK